MPLAEVITLRNSSVDDIPAMLRKLADDCERDGVEQVVTVCFRNGEPDVRGMGKDVPPERALALLNLGCRSMERIIEHEIRNPETTASR